MLILRSSRKYDSLSPSFAQGGSGTWCELFQALVELAAGQHNPPPATMTFQANVGADARHFPDVATTGMWFAQGNGISYLNIHRDHPFGLPPPNGTQADP